MIKTLAPKWFMRLALCVLSRRRKDNGVPTEEYLEVWLMSVPRRTLNDYLSDETVVDARVTLEQIIATHGDLWQFLENHLPHWMCRVDKQFCDTLMRKLCNHCGFIQDPVPYVYGGIIGTALYLQWSQFQGICGMDHPDFEIYYDSNVSIVQSLKHNQSQFETLLTESNRLFTYIELSQRTMCMFPKVRPNLCNCPCSFCTDQMRVQLVTYGIWKECDKCQKPLVVIPTPQELFSYTIGSIGSTEVQCLTCKRTVPISEEKKRQILECHFLSTMTKREMVLPGDSAARSVEVCSMLSRIWDRRSVLHWSNITICCAAAEILRYDYEQLKLPNGGSGQAMSAEELEKMIAELAERYNKFGWRSTMLTVMYETLAQYYEFAGKMSKSRKARRKSRVELLKLIDGTHKAF